MPIHPRLNLAVFSFEGSESMLQVIDTFSIYTNLKVSLTNSLNGVLNPNEVMFWVEVLF
jgi:hypothetical protein